MICHRRIKLRRSFRCFCSGLLATLVIAIATVPGTVLAEPLRLDFSLDEVDPVQSGWEGFGSPDSPAGASRVFANDELAGLGNSVTVTIAGMTHWRDYQEATGIFAPSSDLLRDGPLCNDACTVTLTLDGLLDGSYMINSYQHTTLNGPSSRPPATPFDIRLTDGVVTNSVIATGLTTSDSGSTALSMETFPFQVAGGSPVVINYIRGDSVGGQDHFALPAIEIYTAANPPPPVEILTPPDPPATDTLKVDFSRTGAGQFEIQDGFLGFAADDVAGPGQTASSTRSFAYDNAVGGMVDVTLTGTIPGNGSDFVYRNYEPATGIFEPLSELLRDGPLLNSPGTITLGLDNLEDGLYEITLYHHTVRNGPNSPRGPSSPFDVLLTDGIETDLRVAEDVLMSDNDSDALSQSTFEFSVIGGSSVSIDIVRGATVGGPDHTVLPGFELKLTGSAGCANPGDYDCNDVVDRADVVLLASTLGAENDLTDVALLQAHFGEVNGFPPLSPEPTVAVPEPSEFLLLLVAGGCLLLTERIRRRDRLCLCPLYRREAQTLGTID